MLPLAKPFMKTPEQGAATSIHLASSPEVAGVSGAYFANRRAKQSSRASYDRRPGPPALGGQLRARRHRREPGPPPRHEKEQT